MSTATDDTLGDLFGPSPEADEPEDTATAPAETFSSSDEALLRAAGRTVCDLFAQWCATGRSPETLAAEMRVMVTEAAFEQEQRAKR